MLDIRKNIVSKSEYARELELVEKFEQVLEQVKKYVAQRKLQDAVDDDGRFRFYFSDRFKFLGKLDLIVYEKDNHKLEIRAETKGKTIPDIVAGIAERKTKLVEWLASENEVVIYTTKIERSIEEDMSREQTAEQFNLRKKAYVAYLRQLVDKIGLA